MRPGFTCPHKWPGERKRDQEAVLKLPTFPSRQFGVLRGKLVKMTSTPLQPHDVRLVPNLLSPVYEARVKLERQHMEAMGRRWALRPGLSVEGTIIETRRTLISWVLDPLIRGAGTSRRRHNWIGGPEACKLGGRHLK